MCTPVTNAVPSPSGGDVFVHPCVSSCFHRCTSIWFVVHLSFCRVACFSSCLRFSNRCGGLDFLPGWHKLGMETLAVKGYQIRTSWGCMHGLVVLIFLLCSNCLYQTSGRRDIAMGSRCAESTTQPGPAQQQHQNSLAEEPQNSGSQDAETHPTELCSVLPSFRAAASLKEDQNGDFGFFWLLMNPIPTRASCRR